MFERPTLQQLIARARADLESELGNGRAFLRHTLEAALATVQAGLAHGLHGHLAFLARQLFPDTASLAYLTRHAGIWGVVRKDAAPARGSVVVTGTSGTLVPEGTGWQRSDGTGFTTTTAETISAGTASLTLVADESGLDGNTEPGATLTLSAPVAGLDAQGVVDDGGLRNGVGTEDDASLLSRLLDRIQSPPRSGGPGDYLKWAREVAGVTRAWERPGWLGLGNVGVFFVTEDDAVSPIPNAAKVDEVQVYLDARRPITARVFTLAPVAVALDVDVELVPDTPEIRAGVRAELEALVRNVREPGGTILLSQINEAISVAPGEQDHTLNSPTGDVTHEPNEIAVLGALSTGGVPWG